MLVLHKKRHGINFYIVWFAKERVKKNGIIAYHEYMGEEPKQEHIKFDTLVSDLTETDEEIKLHFSKNCRYYVNRAMREKIDVKMRSGYEITDKHIDDFLDFYEIFWRGKGVILQDKGELKQTLLAYRDVKALGITEAYVNGEKTVYHTHILDELNVRLLHSASLYRQQEENAELRNLIGIANRALHYEEMKYYKSLGKKVYDWGGAGMDADVLQITEFKKSFGGTPVSYYDFEQVNGLLARLFKLVVKILRK